jgi:hypothetical protein
MAGEATDSNEDGRRGHRSKHRRSGVPKVSSSSRGSSDRGSSSHSILANNGASMRNYRVPCKWEKGGERVSVDQMVSPIPGLIAQINGILTTQRYKYATVFVDQATRMGYVHLQKYASVEETLDVKEAFEAYGSTHGIGVKVYHADNSIFKANKWVESCKTASQVLTSAPRKGHRPSGESRISRMRPGQ